jgi:hypothetical protein
VRGGKWSNKIKGYMFKRPVGGYKCFPPLNKSIQKTKGILLVDLRDNKGGGR